MGSTTDKAAGLANEAIGKAKQGIGDVTGSARLKGEGQAQELKGDAQKVAGRCQGGRERRGQQSRERRQRQALSLIEPELQAIVIFWKPERQCSGFFNCRRLRPRPRRPHRARHSGRRASGAGRRRRSASSRRVASPRLQTARRSGTAEPSCWFRPFGCIVVGGVHASSLPQP